MSHVNRSVALVGRPNVGKSRLFNRLIGRREAIVHDRPGVTRDLATAEVVDGHYILMDTGGIGFRPEMTPEVIHAALEEQVDFAIQAASLVLFICDGLEGMTRIDLEIAEHLRRFGKQVILVVNKTESIRDESVLDEFWELGFGEAVAVSAEHGKGCGDLEDRIAATLGPAPEVPDEGEGFVRRLRVSLCGKPNVGKSSLGNWLLKSDRLIVSPVAGTTRDAIEQDLDFQMEGEADPIRFRLVDTAGMKPKRKFNDSLDYFSDLRARSAIERSQVTFLVLDAMTGVTKHDKKLAGDILEAGVGLIIVVNKWDYVQEAFRKGTIGSYETELDFRKAFLESVRTELFFLPDSPILFVSALSGFRVESLLIEAHKLGQRLDMRLSTGEVNRCIGALHERNPPRIAGGHRFKVYYALQVSNHPFVIRAFCNRREKLDDSWFRYLQKGFQERFALQGCPVRFEFVGKPEKNPYYEKREGVDSHARNTLSKHGKAQPTKKVARRKSHRR